ncbi:hypothetical protein ACTXKQ_14955 [Corynebacterium variabile]|uniref:hypothetical protein n=1 Tax=Corynebacterium variabile TaxID=1727 RepID=UPI003FD37A30
MEENQFLGSFPDVSSFDPERISDEIQQKMHSFGDEFIGIELNIRAVWILTDGILRVVLSAESCGSRALLGFEAVARGLLALRDEVDESDLASLFIVDCLAGEDFQGLVSSAKSENILWVHPVVEIPRPNTLDEVQRVPARVHFGIG